MPEPDELAAGELTALPRARPLAGSSPSSAIDDWVLPEPDSPTIASTSPGVHVVVDVDRRREPLALDPEVDAEVAHPQDRLAVVDRRVGRRRRGVNGHWSQVPS